MIDVKARFDAIALTPVGAHIKNMRSSAARAAAFPGGRNAFLWRRGSRNRTPDVFSPCSGTSEQRACYSGRVCVFNQTRSSPSPCRLALPSVSLRQRRSLCPRRPGWPAACARPSATGCPILCRNSRQRSPPIRSSARWMDHGHVSSDRPSGSSCHQSRCLLTSAMASDTTRTVAQRARSSRGTGKCPCAPLARSSHQSSRRPGSGRTWRPESRSGRTGDAPRNPPSPKTGCCRADPHSAGLHCLSTAAWVKRRPSRSRLHAHTQESD